MESDIKSIKEANELIRRRLDDIFKDHDTTCRECHGGIDNSELKILSDRVNELEEEDRKRSDEIRAMKREIVEIEMTFKKFTNVGMSTINRADDNKGDFDTSMKDFETENRNVVVDKTLDSADAEDKLGNKEPSHSDNKKEHITMEENCITETSTEKEQKPPVGLETVKENIKIQRDQAIKEELQSDNSASDDGKETLIREKPVKEKSNRRQVLKPNFQKKVNDRNTSREFKKPSIKHESTKQSVPVEAWWAICKQEEKAASKTEMKYLDGVQTVLCIDISESMADTWKDVQTFVYDYLDGLEKLVTEENFNEENVAFVTFGHETKVQVRLTKELPKIRPAFDQIALGGPSPMFGGILMAVAAAQSCSSTCHVNGAEIHKRVVLITDGFFTEAEVIQGPDEPNTYKQDETFAHIAGILERFPQSGKELICVPVGNANVDILDQLQGIACGKRFSYTEGAKLARRFYLTKRAPIGLGIGGLPGIGLDFGRLLGLGGLGGLAGLPGLSGMEGLGNIEGLTGSSQLHVTTDLSEEDQEHIKEIVEDHKTLTMETISRKRASNDEKKYEESDSDIFPQIGSRVRRGPDWSWNNQDSEGPGTVIGHDEAGRQVWVDWDADGHTNIYHYGGSGRYDVLLVDEPRVIGASENIKVGCLVQPGEAWRYDFQRVGQHEKGTVIRKVGSNKVQVKWSGGFRGDYYFNRDGPSELKLVQYQGEKSRHGQVKDNPVKTKSKNKNKNTMP